MEIEGVVHNGVIVPDDAIALPEGTRVRITPKPPDKPRLASQLQPRDEWERRLLGLAKDCGVSLPNSAVSSDGLYE